MKKFCKPLITRDSPVIREILDSKMPGVYLILPNIPQALGNTIQNFRSERKMLYRLDLYFEIRMNFEPKAIGNRILSLVNESH